MDPDDILLETEAAMEKAFDYMTHEFSSVRTGKASPALVENIDVEAYGTPMKLKQLAVITTPEPRLLVIQPFDASTTKDIEKAIKESKLAINPAAEAKPPPPPTPAPQGPPKSEPRNQTGHQSRGRWQDHPPPDPGALRGAAQRPRQRHQTDG